MKIGVQLYGAFHSFTSSRGETYNRLSHMGFREVEPCVMFSEGFPYQDCGLVRPAELLADIPLIRGNGLELHSVHAFSLDYGRDAAQMCSLAVKAGIHAYVVKLPLLEDRERAAAYVSELMELAAELDKSQVKLLLHNEPRDTLGRIEGKTVLEWVLEQTEGLVTLQADTGNLLAGGQDPEKFLWRNRERITSVHFKDVKLTGDGFVETPVGYGDLDTGACWQFARAAGTAKIVDMDSGSEDDYRKSLETLSGMAQLRDDTDSLLWSLDTVTGEKVLLHRYDGIIEAPNWLRDGDSILFNAGGRIYRYSIKNDSTRQVETGKCLNCNNDHVPSPDNRSLAVSHSDNGIASQVYIVSLETGETRQVTKEPYSFLHGWSPDGRELAYCGIRFTPEGMKTDIYTLPVEGGRERRLTGSDGYSDGCEYAPDGRIWYTSTAPGFMQVYRMEADGTEKTQMTFDRANNWFPHVSPDNRSVVYLTFKAGELDPNEHLPNMFVSLGIMGTDGSGKRKLLDFFGGQGSINVNSWAPDSRHLAIVTYELRHK